MGYTTNPTDPPQISQLKLFPQVPESPSWYVSIGQEGKALESLQWLRRDSKNSEKELKTLAEAFAQKHKQDCELQTEESNVFKKAVNKLQKVCTNFSQPEVYKPFLILVSFFFFQEGSGIYVFLFYSVQIFQEFGTNYNENVITVTIGVMRLIMAILGAILMSKFGRRQLSVFSGLCMSLALLAVSLYLVLVPMMDHPFHMVPVMCIFFHVGFSMTGFLQIPFILSSELFPARCRGVMGGISCSLGYVLIFISVKMYPDLLALVKIQGVLWSFFCVTAAGVVFLLLFLPETKDRSFEEISDGFRNKGKCAQAKCGP